MAYKVLCSFVLSSHKLRSVRSIGLWGVFLYPVNHQGQPAHDGGGQHGYHHLGDVGDVLLVDGVSYSHLGVEALHVDDHAGVEDGEAGEREDEDQADQGEHVDPLVLPGLVQVKFIKTEIDRDVLEVECLEDLGVIFHPAHPARDQPDDGTQGQRQLAVLQVSEGEPDGEEPVDADDKDTQHGNDEEKVLRHQLELAADVSQDKELREIVQSDERSHHYEVDHVGNGKVGNEDIYGFFPQSWRLYNCYSQQDISNHSK